MIRRVLSIIMAQLGWFAVAMLAARGQSTAAALAGVPVLLINATLSGHFTSTLRFGVLAALLGPIADLALVHAGMLSLNTPLLAGVWMPPWWSVLWGMFATAVPFGFSFLKGRPVLAATLGAIAAPFSYFAGAGLGAISLGRSPILSLILVALIWAIAMPLLVRWGAHTTEEVPRG